MNGEVNITWSSIEKDVPYSKVVWSFDKNGIPKYMLIDENGEKLDLKF